MPVLKSKGIKSTIVREGVTRRLVHANNLMLVVIDFDNATANPKKKYTAEEYLELEPNFYCRGAVSFNGEL